MRLVGEVRDGRFIRRLTRFSGEAFLGQRRVLAHIPHSGRLGELLLPGRRVLLRRERGNTRKTAHDLVGVANGRQWVCIDARLPPRLVERTPSAFASPHGVTGTLLLLTLPVLLVRKRDREVGPSIQPSTTSRMRCIPAQEERVGRSSEQGIEESSGQGHRSRHREAR
ncbi:MAG: hypothetical protein ACREJW_00225 [Candidatus Methylomirabilales bacterium]